jgi:hypothetical protein
MKKAMFLFFIVISLSAHAQFQDLPGTRSSFLGFFRMKPIPPLRWLRTAPRFNQVSTNTMQNAYSYWLGASYTSYSENGRFSATHLWDVQGRLRESRASFSLKKNGALSWWRVQISPQRTRPLVIYTIH